MTKVSAENLDKNSNNEVFSQFHAFGRFQRIQYFLICLPLIVVSMMNVNYIFVAENINFRCRVPDCDTQNATVSIPAWWPQSEDTKCFRPVFNVTEPNTTCSIQAEVVFVECDEWIYENRNSVITELDIGCQSWKASLIGTIHNVGMLFSMFLMGWIADKFGRKPTIIVCAVGGAAGISKIFLNSFYAYLGVEFLESFLASGLYTVAIVWMIEVGGETKRVAAGVIFSYAIYVGEVTFAFIAMGFQYWKRLVIAAYAPAILFAVYAIVLRESTRWQLLRGKAVEAKRTFKIIAKINKWNIPNDAIDAIKEEDLRFKLNIASQKEKETVRDIMNSKEIMIRLAVTSFCFFTASFVYYGLAVQAISLPGDKYLNFALTSLTSFPGDLLAFFTFSKYGRRISLQGGFISCGIFITAQAFAPDSISWLKVTLFLLGKLGTALCFTGIYTYSLELFPTSVRGSLFGFCNMFARIGSMLSPLTPLLATQLMVLPSILFASTAFTAALLLSFTPETKTLPMFDTIQEVEVYKSKLVTRF
ncbi:organic cation transporter protein-like isoform X1 [Choristoneura fumiferana]|uniref:organic cation transporter protein-like isoform X1 n=1 Tax=Choristoneura fumiferana TaxID=7141 RepID=UPI003D155280